MRATLLVRSRMILPSFRFGHSLCPLPTIPTPKAFSMLHICFDTRIPPHLSDIQMISTTCHNHIESFLDWVAVGYPCALHIGATRFAITHFCPISDTSRLREPYSHSTRRRSRVYLLCWSGRKNRRPGTCIHVNDSPNYLWYYILC